MKCATYFGGPSVAGYKPDDGQEHLLQHSDGGLDWTLMKVVSDCLEPHIKPGQFACLGDGAPQPWQMAAFHIRGDRMMRAKIFIGFHDRGAQRIEVYGADQPDRLAVFVALKPLGVHVVALRDLDRLRPVVAVGSVTMGFANPVNGLRFRDVSAGVTIEPEQWQAIQQTLAA